MQITFYLGVKDSGCCNLCNPVKLADFEYTCVQIKGSHGGRTVEICLDCLFKLNVAAAGEIVTKEIEPEIVQFAMGGTQHHNHGLLTLAEVASRVSRSERTIWRWIRRGDIKGERIGLRWFIHEAELNAWMSATQEKSHNNTMKK